MLNVEIDELVKSQEMTLPVIPANPGPARRTRLWQAGRGPGQAPESMETKNFWTPATLSRRKPGAGVTAFMTFCRENA
jgi:hypothetical protein